MDSVGPNKRARLDCVVQPAEVFGVVDGKKGWRFGPCVPYEHAYNPTTLHGYCPHEYVGSLRDEKGGKQNWHIGGY